MKKLKKVFNILLNIFKNYQRLIYSFTYLLFFNYNIKNFIYYCKLKYKLYKLDAESIPLFLGMPIAQIIAMDKFTDDQVEDVAMMYIDLRNSNISKSNKAAALEIVAEGFEELDYDLNKDFIYLWFTAYEHFDEITVKKYSNLKENEYFEGAWLEVSPKIIYDNLIIGKKTSFLDNFKSDE